jgi:hypothetical protein
MKQPKKPTKFSFWNYVICGRGELPRPQRKPKQVRQAMSWQDSLNELQQLSAMRGH